MRKIKTTISNEVNVKNIEGYFERTVTKFGTGAKIDAPKNYLGKKVIIIVCKDDEKKEKTKKDENEY